MHESTSSFSKGMENVSNSMTQLGDSMWMVNGNAVILNVHESTTISLKFILPTTITARNIHEFVKRYRSQKL